LTVLNEVRRLPDYAAATDGPTMVRQARRQSRRKEEYMKHPHRGAAGEARPTTAVKSSPAPVLSAGNGDELEVRIREAAYFRYLTRGAEVGHEMEDWLQAEAELLESGQAPDSSH
jgi:hypothetical protein